MNEWPDALHIAVLRFLGGPHQVDGYLRPYRELCQTCAAAALAPVLWHQVDLSGARSLDASTILELLRRFCVQSVQTLSLQGLESVDDTMVRNLVELLRPGQLRHLDLGDCQSFTGEALASLSGLPSLEGISLYNMTNLQDAQLAQLCTACPGLKRLNVSFCEYLQEASTLLRRGGAGTAWSSLQLDGCFRLGVNLLLSEPPGAWSALEELSLDGEDLEIADFIRLPRVCPRLRHLAVSFARELEQPALGALAALPLESVRLKKATRPTDSDWASFFLEHQRAGAAESARPGEGALVSLGASWRQLNVAECELFADSAANALAATPQPLLVDLDLSWCWHLSDVGLRNLLAATPCLRYLKLAGAKNLTGRGLIPCSMLPRLEELDCTSCNSVSDDILEFLHRFFIAVPGEGGSDALPSFEVLPTTVAQVAKMFWSKRPSVGAARLQIKNYYAEYLEDWAQLRPALEVCATAEPLLAELLMGTASVHEPSESNKIGFI